MRDAPESWQTAKFGEVFDFKGGSQPPKSEFASEPRDGYVRLLQIRDFDDDSKAVYIRDQKKWPKCSEHDIMIGRYGASVGKVLGGKAGAYNVALVRLIFDPQRVHAGWARHFCASEYFQGPLKNISRSAQNGFNKEDLAEIEFPLPMLDEQGRIAAKLDSLCKRSKSAREELAHIPRLVQRYRGAVLAAAFCGNLTKQWRLKNGISVDGDWRQTTLGAVSTEVRYGTAAKCHYEPKKTPVLRIPNVVHGRIDLSDMKYGSFSKGEQEKLALKAGDLLVIRSNGSLDLVGRVALVPKAVAGHLYAGYLIRIRLDSKQVYPAFVQYAFEEPSIRRHIEGLAKSTSGVNNINSEQLKAITLRIPSLEEQKEIVEKIHSALSSIDHLRDEATRADKLLDRLDQATLAKAFRGDLLS